MKKQDAYPPDQSVKKLYDRKSCTNLSYVQAFLKACRGRDSVRSVFLLLKAQEREQKQSGGLFLCGGPRKGFSRCRFKRYYFVQITETLCLYRQTVQEVYPPAFLMF